MAVATAKMIENGGILNAAFRERIGIFFLYQTLSYCESTTTFLKIHGFQ
jgi:hypothetical protein